MQAVVSMALTAPGMLLFTHSAPQLEADANDVVGRIFMY